MKQRSVLRRSGALLGLALASSSAPAAAWDPSTTHQGLLESAVTRSAVHLRWMDASGLERGLFTPLRLDPDRLAPDQRRLLQLAMRSAHADSGALPLGGPGSCPSATAPAVTQQFCVDRDLWEHSALGWLRLGMLAEVTPSARHIHHFLDREFDFEAGVATGAGAQTWVDRELPAVVLRTRQARSNGEPRAGIVTGTNFDGKAPSALAWLDDPSDPLAPPKTFEHLALASHAATQAERDHELALALIGVGALIHVAQDLSVPAHARGDATAFFAPLSPAAGDRGLPLQEFVRVEYGRGDLPGVSRDFPTQTPLGIPLAETLAGHLIGEGGYEGVARLAARRFLSESSVPAPAYIEADLSAEAAAAALLGDDHKLAAVETVGARLSPWPADRGYLLSPTGRVLAAFDTDIEGRIRPYLDEACYRDLAATLLPAAAEVSSSLLDLLWPAWPQMTRDGDAISLTIPDWASAELTVMIEDTRTGQRRVLGRHPLVVAGQTRVELGLSPLEEAERVVLLLDAARTQGPPIVREQLLESATMSVATEPVPAEPQATDPELAEPQATDPELAEPQATEPVSAKPQATKPKPAKPQATKPKPGKPSSPITIEPQPVN